jgi:hypothetical protein
MFGIRSDRPPSYWDVVGRHLPLALVTGVALLAASFVPLERMPLIPCTFLRWTGYPCMFCGMTRAFVAMGNGHFGEALAESPMAVLLYGATVATFIWSAAGLALGRRLYWAGHTRPIARYVIAIAVVLLALNWIYRLAIGLR